MELQEGEKSFFRLHGITHDRHVADIVLLTFLNVDGEVDVLVVVAFLLVTQDTCITIAQLVKLVDEFLLVLLVGLWHELLGAECIVPLVHGVGLLQRCIGLAIGHVVLLEGQQFLVADAVPGVETIDDEVLDLHLLVLVHIDGKVHHVLECGIILLIYLDIGILIALAIVVALDDGLGTVDDVGRHLAALGYTYLCVEVFAFRLLDAIIFDVGDARTWGQGNLEPTIVLIHLFERNGDVAEETLSPETLDGIGHFVARHGNGLSNGETRKTDEDIILVVVGTGDFDTAYGVFLTGLCGLVDRRVVNCVVRKFLSQGDACEQHHEEEQYRNFTYH